MPGIFGKFEFKQSKHSIEERKMCHEEFFDLKEIAFKFGKLGSVSLNTNSNGVYEDDAYVISFYGEVFSIEDRKNERAFLIQEPKKLLGLIKQYGKSIIYKLNGSFLIALYDKEKEELIVCNDRFGIHPLYYKIIDGEAFLFASEAKVLFEDKAPEPDYVGLAEFLSFDYCFENRTIFKGIEILLPASVIKISAKGIYKKNYWKFSGIESKKKKSRKKYEEQFYKVYRNAVKCRQADNNNIGLTGGYDSRLILALIDKDVESFNFGNRGGGDVIGAEALADIYNTTHHYINFSKEDFYPYAKDIVYRTDGRCCFDRFYIYGTAKIKGKYANIELSGTGGDAYSGQKSNFTGLFPNMSKKMTSKQVKKESKRIFHDITRGRLSVGYDKSYNTLFKNNTWKEVWNDFQKAVSACNGKTFGAFTMQLKARSLEKNCTLASLSLCNYFLTMRYPVYDYQVMDFFDTVPQRYRYGQNLYVRMIKDYFPKAASVPHSETGKPIGKYNSARVDWITIKTFIKGKLGIAQNQYHNTFNFVKEIILSDKKRLLELIYEQPGSKEGIFDLGQYGSVDHLIECAQKGDGYAYKFLKNIISVSILNNVFFEGKIPMYCDIKK